MELFAGGRIDMPGNAENIARWNGVTFEPLAGGVAPSSNELPVRALEVFDEDGAGPQPPMLFVGGNIRWAFGPPGSNTLQSKNNLVRWDGANWSLVSNHDPVFDLVVFDFDGAGPQESSLCIAYSSGVFVWDGQVMSQLPSNWSGPTALCVFDDGANGPALYAAVGGDISGGGRLNRWSGSAWVPCGLGFGPAQIHALHGFVDPTNGAPLLLAGGEFTYVDGVTFPAPRTPSAFIGAWVGAGASGAPTCLGDGSASACPCGNASPPGNASGCLNSFGIGGKLQTFGAPRLTADTLSLVATQMPNSSALFFQGTNPVNGGLGAVFGDGLRCAGGIVIRLATRLNSVGASSFPLVGEPSVSQAGQIAAPATRLYQTWYRNAAAFCSSGTFNLTNASTVSWTL
jgi:hypothetical protein